MSELAGWGKETSPFHRGEQELQARLSFKERLEAIGHKIMRPFMPDQHRAFFEALPFVIIGSIDRQNRPWASVLFGRPGFITSPDNKSLIIDAAPLKGDPLRDALKEKTPIALVGLEMETRRRNRVNAILRPNKGTGLALEVVQSFGNCPQYIQTRTADFIRDPKDETKSPPASVFTTLTQRATQMISEADTFFVASHNHEDDQRDTGGVDVNHRGGKPGFIKIEGNTLTIPDYRGNFYFSTLGNFLVNPKGGLLFIDFTTGDLLYLTGHVELLWDIDPEIRAFRGADRAWRFTLDHGIHLEKAAPLRWQFDAYSPNTVLTGTWSEAEKRHQAETRREQWQFYKVARIEDESDLIRSFYLAPDDNAALTPYLPGQFLTIKVQPAGMSAPLIRTYTLSSAPSDTLYRLSIKREPARDNETPAGLVSNHLHDTLKPGDKIAAKAPRGRFTFDTAATRPAVLIAAGIGITPMISMARQAASDAISLRHLRPMTIIHAAQTTSQRAFGNEFTRLQTATNGAIRYISIIEKPATGEQAGQDFHFSGRLSAEILQSILPLADYEFFLCGPPAFMQLAYEMVRALGIRDSRIFSESFGPASLQRQSDLTQKIKQPLQTQTASMAIVSFTKTGIEQAWTPEQGSLLDFAEAHGITPNYACRNGVCGSCAVKVQAGEIAYNEPPAFDCADGEALICCARPAKGTERIELDL